MGSLKAERNGRVKITDEHVDPRVFVPFLVLFFPFLSLVPSLPTSLPFPFFVLPIFNLPRLSLSLNFFSPGEIFIHRLQTCRSAENPPWRGGATDLTGRSTALPSLSFSLRFVSILDCPIAAIPIVSFNTILLVI